jgi:hypothetical protein
MKKNQEYNLKSLDEFEYCDASGNSLCRYQIIADQDVKPTSSKLVSNQRSTAGIPHTQFSRFYRLSLVILETQPHQPGSEDVTSKHVEGTLTASLKGRPSDVSEGTFTRTILFLSRSFSLIKLSPFLFI